MELTPNPPDAAASFPDLEPVAVAVFDVLATQPELLAILQRSQAYYELSEHFLRKNEALDEATDAAERAVFEALPQDIRGQFDEVTGFEVFQGFMGVDLRLFTSKVRADTLQET